MTKSTIAFIDIGSRHFMGTGTGPDLLTAAAEMDRNGPCAQGVYEVRDFPYNTAAPAHDGYACYEISDILKLVDLDQFAPFDNTLLESLSEGKFLGIVDLIENDRRY